METLLIGLAFLSAVGWIGLLLILARNGKPACDGGSEFTLRHSAALRLFSILALFGGGTVFGFWAAIAPPQDNTLTIAFAAGAMALALFGFALLWESYRWKLTVTPTGLECRSPWKAPRTVEWSEVQSVTYSSLQGWHIVLFKDGDSFRIPGIVPGVWRFLKVWHAHSSVP